MSNLFIAKVMAVCSILTCFVIYSKSFSLFISIPLIILAIIGSAVLLNASIFSPREVKNALVNLSEACKFANSNKHSKEINQVIDIAYRARKTGILSLKHSLTSYDNPFLKRGVQLLVDINNTNTLCDILNSEMNMVIQQDCIQFQVLDSLKYYVKTFCFLLAAGFFVGFIFNIQDINAAKINFANSFLSLFLGLASVQLILKPLSYKTELYLKEKSLVKEIIIHGLLSIQREENPIVLEEKLVSFINHRI